jgi:5S rRNA maturation endonuclease (ribonuclease M5)
MEKFIKEHIGGYKETTPEIRLTEIPAEVIEVYPYAPSILHLTPQDIIKWNIRYDASNSCLFFPVYHNDKIIAIKVRRLPKVFYFLGSNTNFKRAGIWYGEQFKKTDAIFLVEGERDAILLSRYVTVWASFGEPTTAQLSAIRKLNRKVVLFFDNDEAGKRIRQKAKKQLLNFLPLYYVSDYCGCKDPAEIVEKGKIKKALKSIKKEVL